MNEVDSFNHVNGIILFCHFNFLKSKTKNIERLSRGGRGNLGIETDEEPKKAEGRRWWWSLGDGAQDYVPS